MKVRHCVICNIVRFKTFTGLIFKKGKFSALEDDLLAKAIQNYQNVRSFFLCVMSIDTSIDEIFDIRPNASNYQER